MNNVTDSFQYSVCAIATGHPHRKLDRLAYLSGWPQCIQIAFSHPNRMQNKMQTFSEIVSEFVWIMPLLSSLTAPPDHWPAEISPFPRNNFLILIFRCVRKIRIRLFLLEHNTREIDRETSMEQLECQMNLKWSWQTVKFIQFTCPASDRKSQMDFW